MKKLIPIISMLLLVVVLICSSTYAWFAMNKTVTATGMMVTVTADSSLVISSSLPVGFGNTLNHTFNVSLEPATYDSSYTSRLKYVSNPEAISAVTGRVREGQTLTYANAVAGTHYVDYTVYVAAVGKSLSAQTLSISLYTTSKITNNSHRALSAMIYYSTKSTIGSYKARINLASQSKDSTYNTYNGSASTSVSNITIPASGSKSKYVKLTFRIYFDGALTSSNSTYSLTYDTAIVSGKSYYTYNSSTKKYSKVSSPVASNLAQYYERDALINSNTVNTDGFNFGISITTADATTN